MIIFVTAYLPQKAAWPFNLSLNEKTEKTKQNHQKKVSDHHSLTPDKFAVSFSHKGMPDEKPV